MASDSECESMDLNEVSDWESNETIGTRKKKGKTNTKNNYRRIVFSDSDEERLIELIKSHRFLYDVSDGGYRDRNNKMKTWESIGKTLNKSSELCRRKWKNIRDTYERSRKKMPTGSGATSSSQLKRSELLVFLNTCSTTNNRYKITA